MGDRSNSGGVRNIRAMFEAKVEDTSPPSRGRSPANSELSGTGSRPLSTVRTSFVVVDRSGQLGPMLGLRKSSDAQSGGARSPSLSAEARLDGTALVETPRPLANVKEEEASGYIRAKEGTPVGTDANGRVNGAFIRDAPLDLGTVLKGSPFESDTPQKPKDSRLDTPRRPTPGPIKPSSVKAAAKAFNESAAAAGTSSGIKYSAPKPAAISTKAAASTKIGPGPLSARSAKSEKIAKTPTTPKSIAHSKTNTKQSPITTKSPNQPDGSKEVSKAPAPSKAPVRKTSRLSMAPEKKGKSTATAPTATSLSKTTNASPPVQFPTSQKTSGSGKPGPKSPTRVAKLPAAATASTAASSAKIGSGSRSPSRTSSVGVDRRTSLANNSSRQIGAGIKAKPSRVSLAPSGTNDRPASRTSIPGKGTNEGFLERMTRPTQSSANKSHDKVEVKSPPRGNRVVAKPKRKSEASLLLGDRKPMEKAKDSSDTEIISKEEDTKILEPKFEVPEVEAGEAYELDQDQLEPEQPPVDSMEPKDSVVDQKEINGHNALEFTPEEPVDMADVPPVEAADETEGNSKQGEAESQSQPEGKLEPNLGDSIEPVSTSVSATPESVDS